MPEFATTFADVRADREADVLAALLDLQPLAELVAQVRAEDDDWG